MFSIPDSELSKIVRTRDNTELELRISSADSLSVEKPLFDKILTFLYNNRQSYVLKEYTNYNYTSPLRGQSIRRTVSDSEDTVIDKIKINRRDKDFEQSLTVFKIRLGEAIEAAHPGSTDELQVGLIRVIRRHDVKVEDIHFELSEVRTNPTQTNAGKLTYEIEVELPISRPKEYAIKAIDILVKAALHIYNPPPSYFVKTIQEVDQDMELIKGLSGSSPDRIAVNPVNLKRTDLEQVDKFALTNKLDGERKFVVNLGRGELLIMGSKGYQPSNPSSVYYIRLGQQALQPFILDTEYYKQNFYVFDVAVLGGIRMDTVIEHRQRMAEVNIISSQLDYIKPKKFYYESFQKNLQDFMGDITAKDWFHTSDGFILTEKVSSYTKTRHFKYKFYSKMSIDFKLIYSGVYGKRIVYELHVVNRGTTAAFAVDGVKQLLYSTVQLPDVIAECILYKNEWYVLRVREDKTYPNAITTAESVFQDIRSPIFFTDLVSDKQTYNEYIKTIERLEQSFFQDDLVEKGILIKTLAESNIQAVCIRLCNLFGFNPAQCGVDIENRLTRQLSLTEEEIIYNISQITSTGYFPNGNLSENRIIGDFIKLLNIGEFVDARRQTIFTSFDNYTKSSVYPKNVGLVYHQVQDSGEITLSPFPKNIIETDASYINYVAAWRGKDCISRYSSLMPWHKDQVATILKEWIPKTARVADLTAHVGIDAIHLRETITGVSITAFEIEPKIAEALVTNTFNKGITVVQRDSCFSIYMTRPGTYDVVYIDAPWGGVEYKEEKELELYMDKEGSPKLDVRNVKNVARHILSQQIAKVVILKVPVNFNMNQMDDFKIDKKSVMKNKAEVSYNLLRLQPKFMNPIRGGQLLIWSTPYCDYNDVVFAGGQPNILVRVPTNQLYDTILMKFMKWIYPYRGTTRENLIVEGDLSNKAVTWKYNFISRIELDDVCYLHFSSAEPASFKQQPQPQQPQPQQPQPQQRQTLQQRPLSAPVFTQSVSKNPNKTVYERPVFTSMSYMKKYHNVEKNILIQLFCKKRSVLDLGAGKGGDLSKYSTADVSRLVLVDPSVENLNAEDGLYARLQDMKIKDRTDVMNAYGQDTSPIFDTVMKESRVQVVASFFSMTFLFQSLPILRGFLSTVDACLTEGGYFIGTMMEGTKSQQAFAGSNNRIYDDVTIIKNYEDGAPMTFGNKLYINIKDSIVKDQDEYLAYFYILQKEMERLGFVLEVNYNFNPDSYIDSSKMTEETKKFSKLNIGFAFRKMPKTIPGSISILNEDDSQEFFNLYGELNTLYRTGVAGDGSCFYHAYLMSTDDKYLTDTKETRNTKVKFLRREFASNLTLDVYARLLPLQLHTSLEASLSDDITYRQSVSKQFDEKETPDQVNKYIKLNTVAGERIIQKLKTSIANPKEWADDTHVILFMEYTNTNIYIIHSNTRQPSKLLTSYYKPSRRASIIMLSHPDYHYEAMFVGVVQKTARGKGLYAKRVLKPIDPQLIYLHQWILKQENVVLPMSLDPSSYQTEEVIVGKYGNISRFAKGMTGESEVSPQKSSGSSL